jgi:hypothetical protein
MDAVHRVRRREFVFGVCFWFKNHDKNHFKVLVFLEKLKFGGFFGLSNKSVK